MMTAPQQTAPDGGEGIVGALAAEWCSTFEHGRLVVRPCDACRDEMRDLAPTVARLIEDAVAERLAGVEAALDSWQMRESRYHTVRAIDVDLRAALSGGGEVARPALAASTGALSAEQPSEAPEGRDESPGLSEAPRIDWARMYHGVCPKCREEKFIGHGPLCGDCYYEERA